MGWLMQCGLMPMELGLAAIREDSWQPIFVFYNNRYATLDDRSGINRYTSSYS